MSKAGKPLSPEHVEKMRQWWTPERRQAAGESLRGTHRGKPAVGHFIDMHGYRTLTGQYDHPLADQNFKVKEHRKVLYDKIGPGPHPCHWGCGKTELTWGGLGGNSIIADHLNGAKLDNTPENLVPSCLSCNTRRRNRGNPPDWRFGDGTPNLKRPRKKAPWVAVPDSGGEQ